ncbi:hypothetical protein [Elizabethkingia argenteiflava]|uniref:hypothetical protein n=1 Tax=Elizabethkingia argenteiflava TaxID=2681556 RepID=UPI001BB4319A|nr:hypothetical protein [Elizabethkingia argenteiflava]
MAEPKELMLVPNAVNVDLYDKVEVIPFSKLEIFFKESLKPVVHLGIKKEKRLFI